MINIQGKNKDNNHHKAIDFNALIIDYKDEDKIKIHHRQLSIKKERIYHLKENFYKDKDTTPEPIVIFYKKKHGVTPLQKKLIDDLYIDLNHIYEEYKDNLSKVTDKKSLNKYEIDYQTKIEHLAIKLFSSIEKTSNPSIIEGIILNKFCIGHSQGRFFIQDTDKSFLDEKVSLNKYDSFLTKKPLSAPPIPSNLITETSGLIFDYNNILRAKYDQKTTTAAKEKGKANRKYRGANATTLTFFINNICYLHLKGRMLFKYPANTLHSPIKSYRFRHMNFHYPLSEQSIEALKIAIVQALKDVYDPEIPVNIYDLGLIYNIAIDPQGAVKIEMTLTSPGCPVAQTFPGTVENKVNTVPGVSETVVELVWDPPWTSDNMSEAAKLQLGML